MVLGKAVATLGSMLLTNEGTAAVALSPFTNHFLILPVLVEVAQVPRHLSWQNGGAGVPPSTWSVRVPVEG